MPVASRNFCLNIPWRALRLARLIPITLDSLFLCSLRSLRETVFLFFGCGPAAPIVNLACQVRKSP